MSDQNPTSTVGCDEILTVVNRGTRAHIQETNAGKKWHLACLDWAEM